MKVLILGASGMIGSAMFRILSENLALRVFGTLRFARDTEYFRPALRASLLVDVNVAVPDTLAKIFVTVRPDVVINCIGLTKHVAAGNDAAPSISMNALLPHRIATLCALAGARMIHVSTDCVFSGEKGNYTECDTPDAADVYGRSKQLGEVATDGALTLRTSTIGHEFRTRHGLLEWFLSQTACAGYTRAIFSGVPSIVLAGIVRDLVIPNRALSGLYHVAGPSIAKANLLGLIAATYERDIDITPDDSFVIDRSLNAEKFETRTGYRPPSWPAMIQSMYEDYRKECQPHV